MKIKYFFLAVAMTATTGASAQFVGGGSNRTVGSSSAELDTKAHFVADFRIGSVSSKGGFGINLGGTKEIASFAGCTLAWDFVNVEFAAPFSSPADLDYISAKTGLRLFSPSFANDNVRLYTNLSMGYTCVLTKGSSEFIDKLLEYGGGYQFLNWMEKQDYSADEIKDILEKLEDIEEDINRRHYDEDEEVAAWESALRDNFGGKMEASHGFGLTWGIGVQIKKKYNIGYTLQYETAFKSKNHFATIGYTF